MIWVLQDVLRTAPGIDNQTVINWLRTEAYLIGRIQVTCQSKSLSRLNNVLHDIDIQLIMFALQHCSTDEEVLMVHVKDMILVSGLAGMFKSEETLLASLTDCLKHDVVDVFPRHENKTP